MTQQIAQIQTLLYLTVSHEKIGCGSLHGELLSCGVTKNETPPSITGSQASVSFSGNEDGWRTHLGTEMAHCISRTDGAVALVDADRLQRAADTFLH